MKRPIKFLSITILASTALLFSACSENKASPPAESGGKPSDDGGDDDAGGDDEGSEGGAATGDVCDDGLKKANLDGDFDDLIDAFCDDNLDDVDGKIYGKSDYDKGETGGVSKILLVDDKEEADGQMSYNIFAGNDLDASAADYFAMNKLRNNKPDVYKDADFKVNSQTTMCNVTPGDSQTEYEVRTEDGDSIVWYQGRAKYKKVATGIYVISTKLVKSLDTLIEMKSFTVIMDKGGNKSRVYSAAYQLVDMNSQSADEVKSRAKKSLSAEMWRNFSNAGRADEIADLEDEDSNPGDNCDP